MSKTNDPLDSSEVDYLLDDKDLWPNATLLEPVPGEDLGIRTCECGSLYVVADVVRDEQLSERCPACIETTG